MASKVTIGIPVYNQEKNIDNLLSYLYKSHFNFDFDILVVTSGCTDNSVLVVKKWIKQFHKIKHLNEKLRLGKFVAMNKILENAKEEIIIFINADTLPKKGALNSLLNPFSNPDVGAVTGRPIPTQSSGIIGYFQHLIWNLHHEVSFSFPKITGEICAIRKSLIRKIPNKIVNDDAYFAAVISKTHKIVYQPDAKCLMIEKLDFKSYIKKRRRIAQGYLQLKKLNLDISVPLPLLLKSILKIIAREPTKFFYILSAILIEIYCNILAFYDIQMGKIDYIWDNGRAGI